MLTGLKKRNCCHEAGHTVAWIINGDTVLLIVGSGDAEMNEHQKKLCEQADINLASLKQGGFTIVQTQKHSCEQAGCKGKITTDEANSLRARYHLCAECTGCMELLSTHITCMYAGGPATSLLQQLDPNLDVISYREMERDRGEVDRITRLLIQDDQQLETLKEEARRRAISWINAESDAVIALTSALVEAEGILDGHIAEQVVRKALKGSASNNQRA